MPSANADGQLRRSVIRNGASPCAVPCCAAHSSGCRRSQWAPATATCSLARASSAPPCRRAAAHPSLLFLCVRACVRASVVCLLARKRSGVCALRRAFACMTRCYARRALERAGYRAIAPIRVEVCVLLCHSSSRTSRVTSATTRGRVACTCRWIGCTRLGSASLSRLRARTHAREHAQTHAHASTFADVFRVHTAGASTGGREDLVAYAAAVRVHWCRSHPQRSSAVSRSTRTGLARSSSACSQRPTRCVSSSAQRSTATAQPRHHAVPSQCRIQCASAGCGAACSAQHAADNARPTGPSAQGIIYIYIYMHACMHACIHT